MTTFPLSTSPIEPTYTLDQLREAQANQPERAGTLQLVGDAINSEWATSWFARWAVDQTMERDPDWQLTPELAKELTQGLDPSLWGELSKSESYTHALYIRESLRDVQESRQRLAEAGVTGAALQIGAAILDPAFIAGGALLEAGTAGLGGGGVAAGVAKKAGRIRSALRGGLLATGADIPIQAFISSQDPDQGVREVLMTLAGGWALGGTIGAVFPRRLASREVRQADRMMRDLQAEELETVVQAMGSAGAGSFRRPMEKLTEILSEKGRSYFREQVDPAVRQQRVDNLIDTVFGVDGDAPEISTARQIAAIPREQLEANYQPGPRSNSETPFEGDIPAEGTLRIDPNSGIVERMEMVDPRTLDITEDADAGRSTPQFDRYVQWYKEGRRVPVEVVRNISTGNLTSTNRRRVIAAIDADVDRIPAWVEVDDGTGRGLRYEEAIRIADSATDDIAAGLKSMDPDEALAYMDELQRLDAEGQPRERRVKEFPTGVKGMGDEGSPPMESAPVGADDFDATPLIGGVERIDRVEPVRGTGFIDTIAGTVKSIPRQLKDKRLTDVLRLPTFTVRMGASKDSATRVFGAGMIKENLLRRGDQPIHLSAEEWVKQKRRGSLAVYNRQTGQAFENFNARRSPDSRLTRQEFMRMAIESQRSVLKDADPDIAAAVEANRKILAKIGQMGKDHRLPGFEDFEPDPFYVPRHWNTNAVHAIDGAHGGEVFNDLVRKSILSKNSELLPKSWDDAIAEVNETATTASGNLRSAETVANQLNKRGSRQVDGKAWTADAVRDAKKQRDTVDKIVNGFTESVRGLNTWSARAKAAMLSGTDADELAEMLRAWGLPDADIEQVLYRVSPRDPEAGKVNRAKHRLRLDENAQVTAPDGSVVTLQQLLESDADALMESYAREMFGAMGAQEVYRAVGLHIDPEGGVAIKTWKQMEGILGKRLEEAGHTPEEIEDILKVAEMSDRWVRGLPLRDRVAGKRFFDRTRQVGFLAYSGGFGATQQIEWGGLVAEAGVRAMALQMPAIRTMFRKAADGTLDNAFLARVEQMTGIATDSVNSRYLDHFDYKTLEHPVHGQLDRGLHEFARKASYANGMIPTLVLQKRASIMLATQKWLDIAKSGKIPSKARLASMNLTAEDAAAIAAGVKKYAKTTETAFGTRMDELDLDTWLARDPDTAARYINAMDKWGSRVIQEGDLGSMMPWTTAPWGQVVTQFKTFVLNAWEKQFLHRAQVRDFPAFAGAMWTTMLSALVYIGRTHIQSIGREDREEYLAKRLTLANIAGGAGRYAGWASFMPDVIDTLLPAKYQVFNRNSGLSADIFDIGMSPVPSLFGNAAKAAGSLLTSPFDGDLIPNQREWNAYRKLLPFQTYFGVRNLLDAVGTRLPEEE